MDSGSSTSKLNRAATPPPIIPDHEMRSLIGGGSYGQIWLAQNVVGAFRAVKIVSRSNFNSERPYEREFEGLQRFEPISRSHQGFLQILHIGRKDSEGYFYYVMELGDGREDGWREDPSRYTPRTLDSELQALGRLPLDRCLEIALSLSEALARLHQQKLVHRDLKPSNIVFVNGQPKLADIGLVTEAGPGVTFVGTEGYVPREGPGLPTADIFAMGKVLYEISTGRDCTECPELPEDIPPTTSGISFHEINAVVCKCCEADPAHRYQTAEELRLHLSLIRAGSSVRQLLLIERILRGVKKWALPMALAVCALGAVAFAGWHSRQNAVALKQREQELAQRKMGSFVAMGNQAMDQNDPLGALPWFTAALGLPSLDPNFEEAHRVRMSAVLEQCPKVVQLWFSDRDARYGQFGTNGSGYSALVQVRDGRFQHLKVSDGVPLSQPFGGTAHEEMASLSPQGNLALTTSRLEPRVRLWGLPDGALRADLPFRDYVTFARFDPAGERIVVGLFGGGVVIHELSRGTEIQLQGHSKRVSHVTFDNEGKRILSCGQDGVATIWDVATGDRIVPLVGHGTWVNWGCFSPDGKRVVTAGFDRTIRVWDSATGKEVLPAPLEPPEVVRSVEFSADGETLVAASFDFSVHFWNARTGKPKFAALPHGDHVVYATLSSDGQRVLSVSQNGTTRVWQLPGQATLSLWKALDFDPRATRASVETKGVLNSVDLSEQVLSKTASERHAPISTSMPTGWRELKALSEGAGWVTLSETHPEDLDSPTILESWRIEGTAVRSNRIEVPSGAHDLRVMGAGTCVVLVHSNAQAISAWDVTKGQRLWQTEWHGKSVQGLYPNSEGNRIAAVLSNRAGHWVVVLDAQLGAPLFPNPLRHEAQIRSVEFSPGSRMLAVSCASMVAQSDAAWLWETETGKPIGVPLAHRDGVLFCGFSPTGDRVVTCGEDKVAMIWQAQTGRQLVRPMPHEDQVMHACFSRDGRWLATACKSGSIRLWDAATGDPLTPPRKTSDPLRAVTFDLKDQGVFAWTLGRPRTGMTVMYLPLNREKRSFEEWNAISRVLSAQQYHQTGSLMPSSKEALEESWKWMSTHDPKEFSSKDP